MEKYIDFCRKIGYTDIERVGVVPYRGAFWGHLFRLQLLTAFCAMFQLPRWRTWVRVPSPCILENLGMTLEL